jgi:hypothetical protein
MAENSRKRAVLRTAGGVIDARYEARMRKFTGALTVLCNEHDLAVGIAAIGGSIVIQPMPEKGEVYFEPAWNPLAEQWVLHSYLRPKRGGETD